MFNSAVAAVQCCCAQCREQMTVTPTTEFVNDQGQVEEHTTSTGWKAVCNSTADCKGTVDFIGLSLATHLVTGKIFQKTQWFNRFPKLLESLFPHGGQTPSERWLAYRGITGPDHYDIGTPPHQYGKQTSEPEQRRVLKDPPSPAESDAYSVASSVPVSVAPGTMQEPPTLPRAHLLQQRTRLRCCLPQPGRRPPAESVPPAPPLPAGLPPWRWPLI